MSLLGILLHKRDTSVGTLLERNCLSMDVTFYEFEAYYTKPWDLDPFLEEFSSSLRVTVERGRMVVCGMKGGLKKK